MILKKLLMQEKHSGKTSLLVFLLGLIVIYLFRMFIKQVGLPDSLTTIVIWFILLLVPFVHRPTVWGLLAFKTGLSIYSILLRPRGPFSINGLTSNIVNFIAVLIFTELLYQIIGSLRKMNRELAYESQKATSASNAKAAFLANMSHEIRTPISGILGLTDMLLSDKECSIHVKNHLSMIKSSSDTLLHIVNNILNFTKIEVGKEQNTPVQFSIHSVLHNVVDSLRTTIESKSVELYLHIDESVYPEIIADEVKIKQILFNLISNAIKFTDKGMVKIEVCAQRNMLDITVTDTGIGIPKDKQDLIFTEFERIQTSYEKSREGTGLGLAITKGLVEQLEGEITVESTPSVGSKFRTLLPFTDALESLQVTKGDTVDKEIDTPSGYSILLAEDNPVNQVYLKHFLEKQGYELTIVENGEEAVDLVMSKNFNLVLMDIQMPVKSGIQATKEIRAYEKSTAEKRIPILALTASVTEHEQRLFLKSGMDAVCPKPVDVGNLLTTMNTYLN